MPEPGRVRGVGGVEGRSSLLTDLGGGAVVDGSAARLGDRFG